MYLFTAILEREEISRLVRRYSSEVLLRCSRNSKGGIGLPPFKIHAPKISGIVKFTELRVCH
jgi:hypothetical protein